MSAPEAAGPEPWRWTWSRFDTLDRDTLYDALALRCRVFILEQGPYLDPDGLDRRAWHLLARDEHGTERLYLRVLDPGVKYTEPSIGRVVVDQAARGSGTGRLLMQHGLRLTLAVWPGRGVRISAQHHLLRFYASLGFRPVGEPYLEDRIPHIEMLRPADMPPPGDPA